MQATAPYMPVRLFSLGQQVGWTQVLQDIYAQDDSQCPNHWTVGHHNPYPFHYMASICIFAQVTPSTMMDRLLAAFRDNQEGSNSSWVLNQWAWNSYSRTMILDPVSIRQGTIWSLGVNYWTWRSHRLCPIGTLYLTDLPTPGGNIPVKGTSGQEGINNRRFSTSYA